LRERQTAKDLNQLTPDPQNNNSAHDQGGSRHCIPATAAVEYPERVPRRPDLGAKGAAERGAVPPE
jgi:hypothetical protein